MDTKEKLSKELLREIRKDPSYRKVNDLQQLAKEVGTEISRIRKKKRISEEELAGSLGKNKKVIHRMERGEFKQYTIKLLLDIAAATNSKLQIEFAD